MRVDCRFNGSTLTFMHNKPNVFINPKKFDPSWWLGPTTQHKLTSRKICPVLKGSQSCVGVKGVMHLVKP